MYKSTNTTRSEGTFNLKQKHVTRTQTDGVEGENTITKGINTRFFSYNSRKTPKNDETIP